MMIIRRGERGDLAEVAAIQQASPEAAQWGVADYPDYDFRVAVDSGRVAGFLVARAIGAGECELLNLAVAPEFRRRGVARALIGELSGAFPGAIFLEVRESNRGARLLYKSMGFQEVSRRPDYYGDPPEAAIVLNFHSC